MFSLLTAVVGADLEVVIGLLLIVAGPAYFEAPNVGRLFHSTGPWGTEDLVLAWTSDISKSPSPEGTRFEPILWLRLLAAAIHWLSLTSLWYRVVLGVLAEELPLALPGAWMELETGQTLALDVQTRHGKMDVAYFRLSSHLVPLSSMPL